MSLRDVTFDVAREEMRSRAPLPEPEVVPLQALAGRRLARDVRARIDNPAFTNSAMDGFALRAAEAATGAPLRIVGESRAGYDGEVMWSEDPITGSLNAALAHWMHADGRIRGPVRIAQGTCIERAGRVMIRPGGGDGRILVGGQTHILIDGTVTL